MTCASCGREFPAKDKEKQYGAKLCLYCQLTDGDEERQSRQNFARGDRHRKLDRHTTS